MTQTWYLSCDLHYFIIAIFLTMLVRKNKKLGFAIFICLNVLSLAIPFIITIVYLRPALLQFYPVFLEAPKVHTDFRLTYIKTHTRASPYLVGMIGGYIYYIMKDKQKELSKLVSHSVLFVSIMLLFIGMATGAVFYNPYHKYNALESAVYAALHRPAWAFGTIGILLTASYGHTTIAQRVLSWSPFVPLSKLVYGAYLMHMSFQFRALGMTVASQYFNYFSLISLTVSDIVMSFISGLILYIMIEAPMRRIFRELLMSPRKPTPVPESALGQSMIASNRDCDSRL